MYAHKNPVTMNVVWDEKRWANICKIFEKNFFIRKFPAIKQCQCYAKSWQNDISNKKDHIWGTNNTSLVGHK